jgi:predicted Zn-dependent protease
MTRTVPFALLLVIACTDATPPERVANLYAYTIPLETGFRIVFRWPASSLPVRIWTEPDGDLRAAATAAIRLWEDVVLYGEFNAVLVNDSARADIIMLREGSAPFGRAADGTLRACGGRTHFGVEFDSTITLPFRTILTPRAGASADDVRDCLRIAVAHELGHGLGLLLESDDPSDLMFELPTVSNPSGRDRATFGTLYHSTPTVRVPEHR